MHFDIAWQEVDTVLLDMDGTLWILLSTTISGKRWCRKPGAARGLNQQQAKEAMHQSITPCSIR